MRFMKSKAMVCSIALLFALKIMIVCLLIVVDTVWLSETTVTPVRMSIIDKNFTNNVVEPNRPVRHNVYSVKLIAGDGSTVVCNVSYEMYLMVRFGDRVDLVRETTKSKIFGLEKIQYRLGMPI